MVIELTDRLAQCPVGNYDSLSISIENLLIGYYEGNLILMISGPLCRFIRANGLVKNERAKKALRNIEVGGGFVPAVMWRLQVVLDNPNPANHEVDYLFFTRTITVQPVAFLCENIEDVKFYMKLVRLYHPNTPIKAMYYHGGGGTTVDVFMHLKGMRVLCLVILDSDIKYPGCRRGDTARRCLARYRTTVGYIEVKMLDVHEAENLVPIAFMKQVAYRGGKALLKRMSQQNLLNQIVYYDVKSGIKKENVLEDENYMNYCRDLYNDLYHPRTNTFDRYLTQKRVDSDYIFEQVKANLLESFIEDEAVAYPNDVMSPYREAIARLVHTFVCSRGTDPLN